MVSWDVLGGDVEPQWCPWHRPPQHTECGDPVPTSHYCHVLLVGRRFLHKHDVDPREGWLCSRYSGELIDINGEDSIKVRFEEQRGFRAVQAGGGIGGGAYIYIYIYTIIHVFLNMQTTN